MEPLGDMLAYPTKREDWASTILIGGALTLFGFLLIPLLVVYGYVVRVIRGSLEGASEPPAFEQWAELLVDGAKAFVIGLVYMIPPLVVAGVLIGGTIGAGANAGIAAGFLGFTVTAALMLVFAYVAVAAIVNFAREERFAAAFDFDVLKAVVFHKDYATAWLVSAAIFFVAGAINSIPLIGWILAPFVGFYVAVVAANLWADGFSKALGPTDLAGRASSEEPTV